MDGIYTSMTELIEEYAKTDRLYLTAEEREKRITALRRATIALRKSRTPASRRCFKETASRERLLLLKEIFDRIEIPPSRDIPDREGMARLATKRWRLPGTEIDFVLIPDGPRAGEYMVSAETIERLPEFYEKVMNLPYKPGPANRLNEAYRAVNSGKTDTLYEALQRSPVALASVILAPLDAQPARLGQDPVRRRGGMTNGWYSEHRLSRCGSAHFREPSPGAPRGYPRRG